MIKFTLKCADDHRFESWFQNGEAFDKLQKAGMISCSVCGQSNVEKAIMAPRVASSSTKDRETAENENPLSAPLSEAEQAIRELRTKIEANSEDVGENFANEARSMHYGETPSRSIIGAARPKEAKELLDEGIPVAPLPWGTQKTN